MKNLLISIIILFSFHLQNYFQVAINESGSSPGNSTITSIGSFANWTNISNAIFNIDVKKMWLDSNL